MGLPRRAARTGWHARCAHGVGSSLSMQGMRLPVTSGCAAGLTNSSARWQDLVDLLHARHRDDAPHHVAAAPAARDHRPGGRHRRLPRGVRAPAPPGAPPTPACLQSLAPLLRMLRTACERRRASAMLQARAVIMETRGIGLHGRCRSGHHVAGCARPLHPSWVPGGLLWDAPPTPWCACRGV